MNCKQPLRAESTESGLRIFRGQDEQPIMEQWAEAHHRPYIHPIIAPDGAGVLTENKPPHHPWQNGLYVGLNDINGIGFWEEGLRQKPKDGTFHPRRLQLLEVSGSRAAWEVETDWHDPDGRRMIIEKQRWTLNDHGDTYELDMEWTLTAEVDLIFGQYAYGGLFLRMPYKDELGGRALNSEGLENSETEGKRARWVAVSMPIEGRTDWAGVAIMDHPSNPEHPVPWRVDGQLGISPSRCIAGEWKLAKGESASYKHRVFVFCGQIQPERIEASWSEQIN